MGTPSLKSISKKLTQFRWARISLYYHQTCWIQLRHYSLPAQPHRPSPPWAPYNLWNLQTKSIRDDTYPVSGITELVSTAAPGWSQISVPGPAWAALIYPSCSSLSVIVSIFMRGWWFSEPRVFPWEDFRSPAECSVTRMDRILMYWMVWRFVKYFKK